MEYHDYWKSELEGILFSNQIPVDAEGTEGKRVCCSPNIPKHVYYHYGTQKNSASGTDLQAQLDWAVDSKTRQTLFALLWLLSQLI